MFKRIIAIDPKGKYVQQLSFEPWLTPKEFADIAKAAQGAG
ncbi:hypothetical protein JCM19239_7385 [Vibrio variabilis]|uniref:Uncharacterized protein n=1 Tax=Vibrio variabilis TaxID=990271 RepID=A0ABQ0J965_9VIBR|nr:hypothetical protein JCM19239_7385 [Vibrio variabilis]